MTEKPNEEDVNERFVLKPVKVEKESTSLRAIGRVSGVGHATISRFLSGKDIKLSVAKKLLPHLDKCPCCGNSTTK